MLQDVMSFFESREMFSSYIYYFLLMFTLIVFINLFDRSKGILLMNDKKNFVLHANTFDWVIVMFKYKQVSIIATALIILLNVGSTIINNPYLISISIVILVWKVISFINPSKIVFSEEGIFVVDYLVLGDRKGFFDYAEWSEIDSIFHDSKNKELTIKLKEKLIVLPITTEQYSELITWLNSQYESIRNKVKEETATV